MEPARIHLHRAVCRARPRIPGLYSQGTLDRQTPEEFAKGARITDLADKQGFVVMLPRQKESANPWRCWNWFESRTMNGKGEAAIVASQIRTVRRMYRCHRKRVLVAGMSAGGALAAVMGVRYPGLVRAVAVHSGLACGAAKSPLSAIAVMATGPEQDVAKIADAARAEGSPEVRVPLLAVHGGSDAIVAPRHAVELVRQYLHLNGRVMTGDATATPPQRLRPCPRPTPRRGRRCRAAAPKWSVSGEATAGSSHASSR